jgi:hypothetical protein
LAEEPIKPTRIERFEAIALRGKLNELIRLSLPPLFYFGGFDRVRDFLLTGVRLSFATCSRESERGN